MYNAEEYLRRCIDSILAQTFSDYELLLIDDGSTDPGGICDEYAMKDSRISAIHRKNAGSGVAKNTGIELAFACGDSYYLTFIDSDDWVYPQYLELLYKGLVKNNCNISQCLYVETDEGQEIPAVSNNVLLVTPEEQYLNYYCAVSFCKLYNKGLFRNIRYPAKYYFEDVSIWYKMLFKEERITIIEDVLYYYYVSPDSLTRRGWNNDWMFSIDVYKEMLSFFKYNRQWNRSYMFQKKNTSYSSVFCFMRYMNLMLTIR